MRIMQTPETIGQQTYQESKQMITLSYIYYSAYTNAAGQPDCEKVEVKRDYETTDEDQAGELAMRAWVAPANYIPGTLAIC